MKKFVHSAFFAILVLTMGVSGPAFAGAPPVSIDAQTNKNFYQYGDYVGVSGKLRNYDADIHSDQAVTYLVLDPNGEMATLGQTEPGHFGAFNFSFFAKGEKFLLEGNYSIEITFNSVTSEIPMFYSGGEIAVEDVTPPLIFQPENITVTAQTKDDRVLVKFEVLATDNVDDIVIVNCKPESGHLFGIGETIVKCSAKDSAGNFALPVNFTVTVNPPITAIPVWVKDVAGFWCQDQIDDASFVQGIQYLIDNGIIVVPATSDTISESLEVPQWVKNNACWWSEGSITDLDFASGIEFLVREGVIVV